MTLLQAAAMSSRADLKEAAHQAVRYGLLKMSAKEGGFGQRPDDTLIRADMTALAAYVYQIGRMEDVRLTTGSTKPGAALEAELALEKHLRAGLKRLLVNPEAKDGLFSMTSDERLPSWNATVFGMLAQVQLQFPGSASRPSAQYLYGTPAADRSYPHLSAEVQWGEEGEGYSEHAAWMFTIASMYLFGSQTEQWLSWKAHYGGMLMAKQRPDGGWNGGERGQAVRAAMHALTLTLLSPPPPPPEPDPLPPPAVPKTSAVNAGGQVSL
jgi:hypothetical protein